MSTTDSIQSDMTNVQSPLGLAANRLYTRKLYQSPDR